MTDPVRPVCPPFDLCMLERRRCDLLGHLNDAVDILAAPVLYGVASWAGCVSLDVRHALAQMQRR